MLIHRKKVKKGNLLNRNDELFLYGRIGKKYKAVAYCKSHKCYLEPKDIAEKQCNKKKCKKLEELKK